jgi:hypothetical protein
MIRGKFKTVKSSKVEMVFGRQGRQKLGGGIKADRKTVGNFIVRGAPVPLAGLGKGMVYLLGYI